MTPIFATFTFVQQLNTGLNILGAVGIAAGVFVYFRFRVSAATIKLYQDNQQALDQRISILEQQLADATLKITSLQNQLDVVKDLPLGDIATAMNKMIDVQNTILNTQNTILNHLQANGLIDK